MSKAEELLDSLSIEDIQPFTSEPDIEGHIVIDKDRIIHVPTELKRIAVQYDANIETVTFDCPRYWDEHDLSEMNIYVNYKLPGNLINNIGQSLVKNVRINEDDENIINFDWTIGPILTNNKGDLPFSVCAKSKTNQDSDEAIRWYTEINTELTISEGMDGSGDIEDNYEDLFPDIINDIISKLEGINATYDEKLNAFNDNATSKTESFDTNAETRTTEFNDNAAQKTLDYNNNCISKTDSFNQNSTQKVTEFNDNYTNKLNSFNNNADSRIEEFDAHADLALTSIPKQNAEGTDNTFDDGLKSPLYALAGDGKSEQVTTTGKNKFDTSSLTNRTQKIGASTGNIYTLKPNTQYTVSTNMVTSSSDDSTAIIGTPQSANAFIFVSSDTTTETISSNTHGVGTINNISRTLMTDDTGNIFVGIRESASSSLSDLISKGGYVQIEEGSTATSYEPYTGGQPSPSPDYPQEINSIEGSLEFACRGRNIFDIADVNTYYYHAVGEDVRVDENGWIAITVDNSQSDTEKFNNYWTNFNKYLKPSTNYNLFVEIKEFGGNGYLSIVNETENSQFNNSFSIDFSDMSNNSIKNKICITKSVLNYNDGDSTMLRTFLSTPARTYAKIIFRISVIEDITKTTQNFKYEPYIEPNKVTFNLNDEKLRSVGDVKDKLVVDLDTGDYYKVENVGEVVFDGSEIWGKSGNTSETNYVGVLNGTYLTDLLKCKFDYGRYSIVNYFTASSNLSSKQGFQFYNDNGQYYTSLAFSIDIDTVSTIEAFKQWLSTHNTIVDYPLQTPTTKKLGTLSAEDLGKLKTFKGYNNVTVNTNLGLMNIRFTYGLDIKKYVDNKIAELSAQLIRGE